MAAKVKHSLPKRGELVQAGTLGCRIEGEKCVIDVEQGIPNLTQQLAMPAEYVLRRIFNQSGANRIQVDVNDQLVEVPLTVNHPRLIPALPQWAAPSPTPIKAFTEPSLQGPHSPGKRHGGRSHCEVMLIRQEAPRENLEIVALFEVSQQIDKIDRLLGVREDFLTPSKPVVYVVKPTLNEGPWCTWRTVFSSTIT